MLNHPKTLLNRIGRVTFCWLAIAGYSISAFSWGANGHTAVGILAVEQLQPQTLLMLKEIVNPLTKQAMAEACNWPDVIRETEAGKWSSPLHYINIPRGDEIYTKTRDCPPHSEQPGSADHPPQYCATESIKYFAAGLADPQASREQRWQSFAWLCHLVGDLRHSLEVPAQRHTRQVCLDFAQRSFDLACYLARVDCGLLIHRQQDGWASRKISRGRANECCTVPTFDFGACKNASHFAHENGAAFACGDDDLL
jgi:hypothetical protein